MKSFKDMNESIKDEIAAAKARMKNADTPKKCAKHDWMEVMYTRCSHDTPASKEKHGYSTKVQRKCTNCGKTTWFNERTGKIISR